MEGFWLGLTGLAAGLCGGLLGIGGSIVVIPAMTELMGPKQHLYQATALIVSFFVAVPALVQHVRAKALQRRLLVALAPAAVLGSVAGVSCSELSLFRGERSVYLTGMFGLFLFYVAGREMWRMLAGPRIAIRGLSCSGEHSRWGAAMLVGASTGVVSGLLGVGGGVVAVPLQRRFLGVGVRSAIANSAAMIVLLSIVGGTAKHIALAVNHPEYAWHAPAELALFLIPTAVVGAWVGGRLTHVLPLRLVRAAFMVLLVVAGFRMVHRATEPIRPNAIRVDCTPVCPSPRVATRGLVWTRGAAGPSPGASTSAGG
ncbi:MAG: sulfite exporter TauE/SafE family protein [Phycisphaerae bacterium]